MRGQFTNSVMSSFLLWIDNKILVKGDAYTNIASRFYRTEDNYNNLYSYSLPYKQLVADASITGASIMSGIYVNNVLVTTGVSGLLAVNYQEGQAYFSSNMDAHSISGAYAVKDFNIYLTSEPDYKLLFETKFDVRPKTSKDITGLATNTVTIPAIFLRNETSDNIPFAFGGQEDTRLRIRAIVIADTQFLLDAACSILRDAARSSVALIPVGEMPFNHFGYTSGYNYSKLIENKLSSTDCLWINRVNVSAFNLNHSTVLSDLQTLNLKIFASIVDFEIDSIRFPRQ
jgi:hypothetical protein